MTARGAVGGAAGGGMGAEAIGARSNPAASACWHASPPSNLMNVSGVRESAWEASEPAGAAALAFHAPQASMMLSCAVSAHRMLQWNRQTWGLIRGLQRNERGKREKWDVPGTKKQRCCCI